MAPIRPEGLYPPNATSWWTRTQEQIRALKLKLKGEDMSGPRKGLYDDRPKEEPMDALEYLSSKNEEVESLRTFMLTIKILEEAKVTGKKLTKLPVSILKYIESYEEAYGVLSDDEKEEE